MGKRAFNRLSHAQVERLAILSEELGEAQQAIGKILRHGYQNWHPVDAKTTNRHNLHKELGDILFAIDLLCETKDLEMGTIEHWRKRKRETIKNWLHHQKPNATE